MSKREPSELVKDGFSIFLTDLGQLGYLPEATVNWIALMGWSLDDKTEFFTMQDLIEKFDLSRLNPAPAAINLTKFDHFNGVHIRQLTASDLAQRIKPFFFQNGYMVNDQTLEKIAPIIQERIAGLDEAPEIAGFFFLENVNPAIEDLVGKNMSAAESAVMARKILEVLKSSPDFSASSLDKQLRALVEDTGLKPGQVFGILRAAVTGQPVSPPLFESLEIIGREKSIERVVQAITILEKL